MNKKKLKNRIQEIAHAVVSGGTVSSDVKLKHLQWLAEDVKQRLGVTLPDLQQRAKTEGFLEQEWTDFNNESQKNFSIRARSCIFLVSDWVIYYLVPGASFGMCLRHSKVWLEMAEDWCRECLPDPNDP